MPSKSKNSIILKQTDEGLRYIRAEAMKLLTEETNPTGKLYGLKVDPEASMETVERLLRLAGRVSDLLRVRARAAKMYGTVKKSSNAVAHDSGRPFAHTPF